MEKLITDSVLVATDRCLVIFNVKSPNRSNDRSDHPAKQLSFGETEIVPIKVGCDIHPWMRAYILIVDHPFAAVTDKNGKFEIKGLPSRKHEFWFWQERAGWLEKKLAVRIEAGIATQILHQYDAAKFELE